MAGITAKVVVVSTSRDYDLRAERVPTALHGHCLNFLGGLEVGRAANLWVIVNHHHRNSNHPRPESPSNAPMMSRDLHQENGWQDETISNTDCATAGWVW